MRQQSFRSLRFLLGAVVLCCGSCPVLAVTPMVSLGQDHGLALRSDGTVLAWGSDTQGQLGLGRPLLSNRPVQVAVLSSVRAIGSGPTRSLAVRHDGTVWAWGGNDRGQLGDGTAADQSSPVQVAGVAHALMACSGWNHGAALLQDGSVWTWGTNTDGQLGNGKSGEFWATAPGPVTALSNATAIACTGAQTFALLRDGTARAWGANASGDLGDGTTTNRTLPVPVSGLSEVVAINGRAALKRDGSVWEWGTTT
jgi:alpha-tubulin suppressor-like RCC1 family protein